MAWHKQKQYDPTEAFLANNKQQQLLEIKLKDIDKLWFARVKYYARDRLETTAELQRLIEDKRHLDYYKATLNPEELKQYTDQIGKVMKLSHKELTSDNFDFDKYKRRSSMVVPPSTFFPRIEKHNTEINFKLRRESMISKSDLKKSNKIKSSSKSKSSSDVSLLLRSSRLMSMSDTDLFKRSTWEKPNSATQQLKRSRSDLEQRLKTDIFKKSKDFKNSKLDLESILRVADVNCPDVLTKQQTKQISSRKLPLLAPKKIIVSKDEHRYLKHHMETTMLPPLSEDGQKRKMSC